MEPFKSLVYGLRRYDADRAAAAGYTEADVPPTATTPHHERIQIHAYMSHKSRIYLADVYDHIDYALSSLDMFAGISENLVNYTFNVSR